MALLVAVAMEEMDRATQSKALQFQPKLAEEEVVFIVQDTQVGRAVLEAVAMVAQAVN
tara:strand:- start:231 stop:404 length:174 start_codon:yes stop_codon:yes gene_type:complete